MALINCYECSGEMSTAASACPKCGAPSKAETTPEQPKKTAKTRPFFKFLGGVLVFLFILAMVMSKDPGPNKGSNAAASAQTEATTTSTAGSAQNAAAPAVTVAPPPEPSHNYSMVENGEYGYETAISADEKASGLVTKPMVMVRYLGEKGETRTIDMVDGAKHLIVSCEWPCQFVKVKAVVAGQVLDEQRMRSAAGSLISGIMDDAFGDNLQPYKTSAKKPQQAASED